MSVAKFLILATLVCSLFACKSSKNIIQTPENVVNTTQIQFTVEENGDITNVKIYRSSGNPLLDAEAIRVVKKMEKWNSQQEKRTFILPIQFNLSETTQSDSINNSLDNIPID